MPNLSYWFDEELIVPWEESKETPWSDYQGELFYTYPLSQLLPYCVVTESDIANCPDRCLITDIHPDSQIGKSVNTKEGTFILELPQNFDLYLNSLLGRHCTRFKKNLERNSDLTIEHNVNGAIDLVWSYYVDRLNELAKRNGAENYTEEELSWRYKLYTTKYINTLCIYENNTLLAVNISYLRDNVVFDLSCIIRPIGASLSRTLGTFAILKNIEYSIEKGVKVYDLLSNNYGYKSSFGAKERKLKAYIKGDKNFLNEYQLNGIFD